VFSSQFAAPMSSSGASGLTTREKKEKSFELRTRSLYCFTVHHPLRILCVNIVKSDRFFYATLVVTWLNLIQIIARFSLTNGNDAAVTGLDFTTLENTFMCIDVIFIAYFFFELVVKIVAGGFLFAGAASYLRNVWNVNDFIVIIFA
jgi:hypothetical protein